MTRPFLLASTVLGYFLGHEAVTRAVMPRRLGWAGVSSSSSVVSPSFSVQTSSESDVLVEDCDRSAESDMGKAAWGTTVEAQELKVYA